VLDRASGLRDLVVDPGTSAYRIVHGENDGLPGVRLDWWDHFATLVLDTPAAMPLVPGILSWLADRRQARGVYMHWRLDPRDPRDEKSFSPEPGLLAGHACAGDVRVTERGVAFRVKPQSGQDVGLYADMREVRAWLDPYWGGQRVLNTFAFTGAFSVVAARNGASEVVSVDLSAQSLDRIEENFAANEIDLGVHEAYAEDVFKSFDRFRRTGREFDRVILDPPAFSRGAGVWSAKKDYPRLVAAAARVTAADGWIIAASNQGEVAPREFRGLVAEGLKRAGREAQEIKWFTAAPDFPGLVTFPESQYLKVGVWRLA
jgi:23S rRNA (cytosine1962-C5)-methyltransferase